MNFDIKKFLSNTLTIAFVNLFLAIVYPFINFYSINIGVDRAIFDVQGFFQFSLGSVALSLAFIVTLTFLTTYIFKSTFAKSFFAAFSLWWLMLFLYRDFTNVLEGVITNRNLLYVSDINLLYLILATMLTVLVWLLSKSRNFHLIFLVYILVVVIQPVANVLNQMVFVKTTTKNELVQNLDQQIQFSLDVLAPSKLKKDLPNIYFIVLDGYASNSSLLNNLGFDNTAFIKQMELEGFQYQSKSYSSYSTTYLTLASIMLGNYPVTELSEKFLNRSEFYPSLLHAKQPPPLVSTAKNLGYEFKLFGNSWSGNHGPHVLEPEPLSGLPYYVDEFLANSPILKIFSLINRNSKQLSEHPNDALRRLMEHLNKKNASKENQKNAIVISDFFFVHHFQPHYPYIFDADCNSRPYWNDNFKAWSESAKNIYIEAIQCANKQIISFNKFIKQNDPSAVIVIQADHGSGFSGDPSISPSQWSQNSVEERMGIISLAKVPSSCDNWLTDDLNSVNIIRFIFGCVTDTEPKYIENNSYIAGYEDDSEYGKVFKTKTLN